MSSKMTPDGTVTTLAGKAPEFGSVDGTSASARFSGPTGVAVDRAGNFYVADGKNSTIRKITPIGTVTTLAGTAGSFGSADGTGAAARFHAPSGVTVDGAGIIDVADTANCTIRQIIMTGAVTTLAGSAGNLGSTDGTGMAALFSEPSAVAADSAGNIYVADTANYEIRKVTTAGAVTTIAGKAGALGSLNGTGPRHCSINRRASRSTVPATSTSRIRGIPRSARSRPPGS